MTLPDERYRAVLWAGRFLQSLCYSSETPRVPLKIRQEARSILRHFPSQWDMDRASTAAPDVFQQQMEAVSRLFAQYELNKLKENTNGTDLDSDGIQSVKKSTTA
jgi:hypothetical protein